jgi:hypothetical protein
VSILRSGFNEMAVATSSRWTVTLDLEDVSLKPWSEDEALSLAREAESGTLDATGEGGDYVELQFNAAHALVLYMTAGGTDLRPHFPNRKESGEGVEEFFCECCGVQLGDQAELLRRCMSREEGFRVCREILRGRLPEKVPAAQPEQLYLPLAEFAEAADAWSCVEWLPLQARRTSSS